MNLKKFAGGVAMITCGILSAIVIFTQYQNCEHAVRRWLRERRENDDA